METFTKAAFKIATALPSRFSARQINSQEHSPQIQSQSPCPTRTSTYLELEPFRISSDPNLLLLDDDDASSDESSNKSSEDESYQQQDLVIDPALLLPSSPTSSSIVCHVSVVYSETWAAPVLYFHLLDSSTNTIINNRSVALQTLGLSSDDPRTYEIASMEYHPYTQIPSFFLHPCRTNETISSLSKKGGLTIDRDDNALLTFLNLNLKLFPDQNLSLDEIGAVLKALEMK
ncbi:hypothetical protein TrVE_jg6154 [Triparma verrucosa]|uniref:Ubiquitin-like-conjugating enzyme ATG10 n=1 Tax=Triparma verrucosa TaxID=1606542 RepID=A0A9W7C311_9STRA|nr:hypothetical protein TrVE_jg6154 [Triparma verrucosa]